MEITTKMDKLLEIKNLNIQFIQKKQFWTQVNIVHAVNDISFDVYAGETLGIVGESGCGKSSLARALVGLNPIFSGDISFMSHIHLAQANHQQWITLHKDIQLIFQDPVAALDPRLTVAEIIGEPLMVYYKYLSKAEMLDKINNMLKDVGLSSDHMSAYPTQLSGGQCQRVGIARALILQPKILICDESVSALDVSIKAQIINLLKQLQSKFNLTIIFISHDLSIIKHICDRVMVMYLGKIMELATKENLYKIQYHPYTQALLNAVPIASPKIERNKARQLLQGDLPSTINLPTGCVFHTRCPIADNQCRTTTPITKSLPDGTLVACLKV